MATLLFKNLNKIYGKDVRAVKDFNLEIADKEFVVFVGPSGCGKTTTLRMVAGLEEISSGELYIDGVLVNDVMAKNREIAMVFQNYALYPHMTVYDNMCFSLKIKKVDKHEIHERVMEAAKILGLEQYLDRRPGELSGGQRQRVALGRAIVRRPKVFLMDEPLSNLDAKLRVQMRSEISKIHERVGATTIYVTHDQIEAMTMADRIVIMKDGIIQQIGTPKEVYSHPQNIFVAGFIGSPAMNLIPCEFKDEKIIINQNKLLLTKGDEEKLKDYFKNKEYKDLIFGIRPEDLLIETVKENPISLNAEVVELLGKDVCIYTTLNGTNFVINVPNTVQIEEHQDFVLGLTKEKFHFFDGKTGERIN